MLKKIMMTALITMGFVGATSACRAHVKTPSGLKAGGAVGTR